MYDQGVSVAILDHHETAKDQLEELSEAALLYTIADDFSGASLIKALGRAVNDVFGCDAWDGWDEVQCARGLVFTNNELYQRIDPTQIAENSLYHLAEIRDIWLDDSPYKSRADAVGANFRLRYPDQPNTLMVGYFKDQGPYITGLGLRSTGGFARVIADEFGGGGHDAAAGAQVRDYRFNPETLKQKIIGILQDTE